MISCKVILYHLGNIYFLQESFSYSLCLLDLSTSEHNYSISIEKQSDCSKEGLFETLSIAGENYFHKS